MEDVNMINETPITDLNSNRMQVENSCAPLRQAAPAYETDPKDELDRETWKTYWEIAPEVDKEMSKRWNSDLDALLIFAALFSAVVTTFVIDSYKELVPDGGVSSIELLTELLVMQLPPERREAYVGSIRNSSPTFNEASAIRVNCLWFGSLVISLSAAFLSILAKQWILNVGDNLGTLPKASGRQHQYRQQNLKKWRLPIWVSTLPVLMHISLLLFFVGLVEFTSSINRSVYYVTTFLVALTGGIYIITHALPFFIVSCPYRTSVTLVVVPSLNIALKEVFADIVTLIWAIPLTCSVIIDALGTKRDNKIIGAGSVFTYCIRFRTVFKHLWVIQTLPWFAWRRRELKAIEGSEKSLDSNALAWIIGQFLWVDKKSGDLGKELCRVYETLRDRRLYIDAGAVVLLAHELKSMYNQSFELLENPRDALGYATTLARLVTEVEEGDPDTAVSFLPDGIPYNIDIDESARTHLISSGFCHLTAPLTDTSNLIFFASILRLHVFRLNNSAENNETDDEYILKLAAAVKNFVVRVKSSVQDFQHLDRAQLMIIVNTIIYIGIRANLLKQPLIKGNDTQKSELPFKAFEAENHPVTSDVDQKMALEALHAVVRSTPEIDIAIRRQILWGLWALSTDDDRYLGNDEVLIPMFTQTTSQYGLISELMTERMGEPLVFRTSLEVLASLVYLEDSTNERTQFFQPFVDKFPRMVRNFREKLDKKELPQESLKDIFRLMVNLWYFAFLSPFKHPAGALPTSGIDAGSLFDLLSSVHSGLGSIEDKHFFRLAIYQATSRIVSLYFANARDQSVQPLLYDGSGQSMDVQLSPNPDAEAEVLSPSITDPSFTYVAATEVSRELRADTAPGLNTTSHKQRPKVRREKSYFDRVPVLLTHDAADLGAEIAKGLLEHLTMLADLVDLSRDAAREFQRARLPPDAVTHAFMQMFTNALRDMQQSENKSSPFVTTLSRNPELILTRLKTLRDARIQGAGDALDVFKSSTEAGGPAEV